MTGIGLSMVVEKQFNQMIALQGNEIAAVPVEKVMDQQRLVPHDSPLIEAALAVGTHFGG